MNNKVSIEIMADRLTEGKEYKSLRQAGIELLLVNGKPFTQTGSYKNAIIEVLVNYEYADISTEQKTSNSSIKVKINKVFSTPQTKKQTKLKKDKKSEITKYMRPILYEMVNNEYTDVCIIKYHKGLTVDLDFIGQGYKALCKALHQGNDLPDGMLNKDDYANYLIRKINDKIKSDLNYNCENLGYENVFTYKVPMNDYDFMNYSDRQLYKNFKKEAKDELEEEMKPIKEKNPKARINYSSLPITAAHKFNEHKKSLDPKYKPAKITEAWVFEVDGNFIPIAQNTDPLRLNREILYRFLKNVRYEALYEYTQTQEYKDIISEGNHFTGKSPFICNDKEVRQALTIRNRDKIAEKKGVDEKDIEMDFSILNIDSYLCDIRRVYRACKI